MRRGIRVCLIALAGCLVLAAVCGVLALPGAALAKKPDKPGGGKPDKPDKPGGGDQFNNQGYWVWFSQDPLGAFEPEGPAPREGFVFDPPEGSNNGVVAGSIADPDDPRMLVSGNQSCLVYFGNAKTILSALLADADPLTSDSQADLDACFPGTSRGTLVIPSDGTRVSMAIHGRSKKGGPQQYWLAVELVNPLPWNPLAIPRGDTVTLFLGKWTLSSTKKSGCFASGDFSDDVDPITSAVGTTITVKRWTQAEQDAQDACE